MFTNVDAEHIDTVIAGAILLRDVALPLCEAFVLLLIMCAACAIELIVDKHVKSGPQAKNWFSTSVVFAVIAILVSISVFCYELSIVENFPDLRMSAIGFLAAIILPIVISTCCGAYDKFKELETVAWYYPSTLRK